MRRLPLLLLHALTFALSSSASNAAEPIAPGTLPSSPTPTAGQVALHEYLYVDFPRCIQSLADARELADAELDFLRARVDNYRPFRSFKQYSPAYTADRSWQLALLAAEQRRTELQNAEADLWRQRRAVGAAMMQSVER